MEVVLRVKDLHKEFNDKKVINNLSFHVNKGEVYALVGVNASGKSTLMKMITDLQKPMSGEILIFGEKVDENRQNIFKRVSAIIENPIFYEELTGRKNLELVCGYYDIDPKERIESVKKLINLSGILDKKVKELSLGMRERLAIARGLLNEPELFILDEPTNGLDFVKVKDLMNLVKKLKKEKQTSFIIVSHMLNQVEAVADRIGFINNGTIVKEMNIEELKSENREFVEIVCSDVVKATYILEAKLEIDDYLVINTTTIRLYDLKKDYNDIIVRLIENEIKIESFIRKKRKLEECFLETIVGGVYNV